MKKNFKMHVLIIDDDPHSIKLMDRILHKAGYNKTSTALSVQEANKIISTTPPDLILLDIVMPEMNGLRLCKKIKQNPATRDIPVIMVTGSGVLLDRSITQSFRAGATDYITKPIRGAEFLARIEAALRVKQHSDEIRKELDRRKKAEEALRKSEALLESVFRAVPIGIAVVYDRIVRSVNKRLCIISGYDEKAILGKNTRVFYADDDEFDRTGRELYGKLCAKETPSVEAILCRRDGEHRNAVLRAAPLESGNPAAGVVVTVEDITAQKRAEKALNTSEKKLQSVMDAALDAIVMIDPQGNIALWNAAAESLFGYTAREVMGCNLHRIMSSDETVLKEYEKGFTDFQRTGTGAVINQILELTAVRKDGLHIPIELSVALSMLDGQKYSVGIVREISARKKAEKEREQLIARLREAMQNIKQLKELLPICASCKKIRDDQGYWNEVEIYIEQHTDARFSHGICPECAKKLYPDL